MATLIGALVVVAAIAFAFMWPFLLGSYLAVEVLGAANPSLLRSTIGWIFEVPWLVFLVWAAITALRRTRTNSGASRD